MIISRTPFRVSFVGGGTDYPDWFRAHGGAVLSTTIDKYCYISLRELPPFFDHRYRIVYSVIESVKEVSEIKHPAVRAVLEWTGNDRGLEIHHDGDLPARSGLGSSSAFTVGLIHAVKALDGQPITKDELARSAIHVEQCVIREPVGSQDQISTAVGGFNRIQFMPDGEFHVTPIGLPREKLEWLEQHLMLVFTGISRNSSDVARTKVENLRHRAAELQAMREMVDHAFEVLHSPRTSIVEFGKLLHDGWALKKRLSDRVSTPHIDQLYDAARRAGAIGGKILGAGGGGFVLLFVEPPNHRAVKEALGGLLHVPFHFESSGSRLVLNQPDGP